MTIGNLIKRDETLLTTVVSQDPMYAYFDIDEPTILRVERLAQEGKLRRTANKDTFPVEMGLSDEGDRYPHDGEIDFINNRMDPTTGTLQLRGVFPNPALGVRSLRLLTPGLFVRIRLPIGEPHEAVLVPRGAVGTDQGKKYLLVVNERDTVEYRPIELGAEQPGGLQVVLPVNMVRTKEGLRPAGEPAPPAQETVPSIAATDRVLVSGLQKVRPGVHVQPRPAEDPAAPVVIDSPDSLSLREKAGVRGVEKAKPAEDSPGSQPSP
jgi:multidrug efflux system membrane fusion protein